MTRSIMAGLSMSTGNGPTRGGRTANLAPERTKGRGLLAAPFVLFCLAVADSSATCLAR
jgi:hypothetical protein